MSIKGSAWCQVKGGQKIAIVYGLDEKNQRWAKVGVPLPMTSKGDNEMQIAEIGAVLTAKDAEAVSTFLNSQPEETD